MTASTSVTQLDCDAAVRDLGLTTVVIALRATAEEVVWRGTLLVLAQRYGLPVVWLAATSLLFGSTSPCSRSPRAPRTMAVGDSLRLSWRRHPSPRQPDRMVTVILGRHGPGCPIPAHRLSSGTPLRSGSGDRRRSATSP
ncbi:MAG: CPBP family intramembrane metalloprotease [Acidimicrobiia bacterium]|nr:CPBP family intramembrane metalloprotease [Acidimicrobiia bacterium]